MKSFSFALGLSLFVLIPIQDAYFDLFKKVILKGDGYKLLGFGCLFNTVFLTGKKTLQV